MASPAPRSAKPSKSVFDAWNSSSTGHQRAENRLSGSTSWRDSRSLKLNEQFRSDPGGGKRINDTVGAGSLDFGLDGRLGNGAWTKGARGLRTSGQLSILESMTVEKDVERPNKRAKTGSPPPQAPTRVVNPWAPFRKEHGGVRESSWTSHESSPSHLLTPQDRSSLPFSPAEEEEEAEGIEDENEESAEKTPQIFANLCFYINGSTAPIISDHKLKHILSSHGGQISISLGNKTVTHVIISRPSSNGGCGGGLASSKLEKEITRTGGRPVRYVTAEWVVESVKAVRRLPETKFEGTRMARKHVRSVTEMFGAKTSI